MARYYLHALGCRLNQAELDALARKLAGQGHSIVLSPEEADVIILNTCAVTAEAERKSRQVFRRLQRLNKCARLVVTGCYAELDRAIGGAGGGALILSMAQKRRLIEKPAPLLGEGIAEPVQQCLGRRTRAFVRIQEGCDNRCTYCIVWRARGPQRSRRQEDILAEVRELLDVGYQEIVLTGVHIGQYGTDLGIERGGLSQLVRLLLREERLQRLRLSSLEPWDAESLDLSLWQDDRLCPHLHLPLQSGSDRILQLMGRYYSVQQYLSLVERLYSSIPDLAITTDIIAGFPTETEEDLGRTMAAMKAAGFSRVHIFPYSPRPGTVAAAMPGQVPPRERVWRARQLRELGADLSLEYRRRFIGRRLPVLWENKKGAFWTGLTPNYLRAYCQAPGTLRNKILPALVLEPFQDGLLVALPGCE